MDTSWTMVYILWGLIIAVAAGLWIWEECKSPEQKKRETEMAQKRYEQARLAEKIVEVRLLADTTTRSKRGGMCGAMLGLFIGGVAGAAVGAVLPGTKTEVVRYFLVKYGDGHKEVRQCVQGSGTYKAWMKRVKNQ